jgi:2-hydroxychromene-2-carboxylate isomerase
MFPIDFFYGLGSRYAYLASTRIEGLEGETGCQVRWRPLFSGDLFAARGADPFQGRPVSGQYEGAWRRLDAERWADYYGVPFREPGDVSFEPRRLARAATAAARLGAVERFSRRLFQAIFVEGRSPLDDAALIALGAEAGIEPAAFHRTIEEPETAQELAATVRDALTVGVFGVPSFVVEGRVYFGNDRLPLVRHALLKRSRG